MTSQFKIWPMSAHLSIFHNVLCHELFGSCLSVYLTFKTVHVLFWENLLFVLQLESSYMYFKPLLWMLNSRNSLLTASLMKLALCVLVMILFSIFITLIYSFHGCLYQLESVIQESKDSSCNILSLVQYLAHG